jgi:hypothetical protein
LRRGKSRARGSHASGDQSAVGRDGLGELGVFRRIDAIKASRQHREGTGGEARPVGGGVDPAREARGDREARAAEIAREPFGKAHPRRRRIARADDGDHGQRKRRRPAAHRQQRRSVVDHLQATRIVRFAQRQQGHPQSGGGLELALGILARVYADGSGRAAAAGEIGQRVQGRARSAVVVDE